MSKPPLKGRVYVLKVFFESGPDDREWYTAIKGVYSTYERAEQARAAYPKRFGFRLEISEWELDDDNA